MAIKRISRLDHSVLGTTSQLLNNRRHVLYPSRRISYLQIDCKYVLKPTGDGTTGHLGGGTIPPTPAFPLENGVFELGRRAPADIVIPVPTVSGRHALIRVSDTSVLLTDLESTNGTYINREELKPMEATELKLNNEVIFGDEHLAQFVLIDDPSLDKSE